MTSELIDGYIESCSSEHARPEMRDFELAQFFFFFSFYSFFYALWAHHRQMES